MTSGIKYLLGVAWIVLDIQLQQSPGLNWFKFLQVLQIAIQYKKATCRRASSHAPRSFPSPTEVDCLMYGIWRCAFNQLGALHLTVHLHLTSATKSYRAAQCNAVATAIAIDTLQLPGTKICLWDKN